MNTVTSKDGTTIAFDRMGEGPPVILVCGGSVDRTADARIAEELASDFTVFNYDRRGRGDSGDTLPYAIEREVEDIHASWRKQEGGEPVGPVVRCRAGAHRGGERASDDEARALGAPVHPRGVPASTRRSGGAVRADGGRGRRGMAEYFMTKVVGMPAEFVAKARTEPWWPSQEALAHTLAYDARIMGDYTVPTELAGSVKVPTIVIAGGADFPWMRETATSLADALPEGQVRFLDGQGHDVDPKVLAPVLKEFFA